MDNITKVTVGRKMMRLEDKCGVPENRLDFRIKEIISG